MDKFNVENKTLLVKFQELEEEYNIKKKEITPSKGKYIPPSRMRRNQEFKRKEEKSIDINDLNEFPPLC